MRDGKPAALFTPCALEQYVFMEPISAGAANVMETFQAAYEVTGKELYLAKAVALANAIMVARKEGIRGADDGAGWPNCNVYAAQRLLRLAEFLRRRNLRVQQQADVPATRTS
jgi:hypothetical protein